jgi:hypothetical protein
LKWQERGLKEGVEGAFIPLTQNIVVIALRPGVSEVNPETPCHTLKFPISGCE